MPLTFRAWQIKVTQFGEELGIGDPFDWPDVNWWDWWDEELSPRQAVRQMLVENGVPLSDVNEVVA